MSQKLILLATTLVITGLCVAQQKPFIIEGSIDGKSGDYIYMRYGDDSNKPVIDSSRIEKGRFSFRGRLAGPAMATLMMDRNGRSFDKYVQLFIMPAQMTLSIPYDHFNDGAKLSGSSVQDEWDRLQQSKAAVREEMKPLSLAYDKASQVYREALQAKKDEATLEALKEETEKIREAMSPYQRRMSRMDQDFMDKHPSSYVTAYLLRFAVTRMSLKEGDERYNRLSAAVKNSELGKTIKQELDELRAGSPGATAFKFASQELRGGELKLADFRGKYVLVDFWASWCVPCRKGNPHLLSLYAKYKPKGLEIIGVSDDDNNLEAWRKAVEKDGIGVWKHVLRGLKRVDGPEVFDRSASISDKYGISSLPTKILIDPNGVIIGRYGGGGENDDAMDQKLAQIFGEKVASGH